MGKMRILLTFLFIIFMGFFQECEAQKFYIQISGEITNYFNGELIKGVEVKVESPNQVKTLMTKRNGLYGFRLDKGTYYHLTYSKEGMITKHIDIDGTTIPEFPDVPFYDMDVQMTMIDTIPKFDFSLFRSPLGIASYKKSTRNMSWNNEYTDSVGYSLDSIMREYKKEYRGYYLVSKNVNPYAMSDSTVDTVEAIVMNITEYENTLNKSDTVISNISFDSIQGLFFTIQIGRYSESIPEEALAKIGGLNGQTMTNGKKLYTTGFFRDLNSATKRREQILVTGINDAYVLAFNDGKRILIKEALELLNK